MKVANSALAQNVNIHDGAETIPGVIRVPRLLQFICLEASLSYILLFNTAVPAGLLLALRSSLTSA